MPASRSVQQGNHCAREDFLYELKAGPAGGLRPPSGPAATRRPSESWPHLTREQGIGAHEPSWWYDMRSSFYMG
jgi:hypothetical protein